MPVERLQNRSGLRLGKEVDRDRDRGVASESSSLYWLVAGVKFSPERTEHGTPVVETAGSIHSGKADKKVRRFHLGRSETLVHVCPDQWE